MNRIQKVLVAALATSLVAASTSNAANAGTNSSSGASKIDALLGDPVVAKGKGVEIKRSQLDAEMLNVQAMASARRQQIPAEQVGLIEREKLNDLIGFQLLLKKANDADKAKGKEQGADHALVQPADRDPVPVPVNLTLAWPRLFCP
jgi:hypothetical protein